MAAEMLLVNPRRRRRRKTTKARSNPVRRRRAAPARRTRRTYARRNPARRYRRRSGNMTSNFMNKTLVPAAGGALGALAVDVAWGFLPVPAQFKTGMLAPFAKMGGAVAVGWGLSQFTSKATGRMVMAGAITVSLYNLFRNLTQQMLPQVPLGYVQAGEFFPGSAPLNYLPDYTPETNEMGEYVSGMGEYVSEYDYS